MATAVTGKAQAPGDFSLLSLRYYILFYDWSFFYWNYLPFKKKKNQTQKEIWRQCPPKSADRFQKARVLLSRQKYLQLPADPLISIQSLLQCPGNWMHALVDPVFSVDYIYSFLQYMHYCCPALGNYRIPLICENPMWPLRWRIGSWTQVWVLKLDKSERQVNFLILKKIRPLFVSGDLLSFLITEIVSFIKIQ